MHPLEATLTSSTHPRLPNRTQAWRYSASEAPRAERAAAWRGVLARLRLPQGEPAPSEALFGEVTSIVSPQGLNFSVISASPQTISGRVADRPATVWLAVLLSGQASFSDSDAVFSLKAGDIFYGPGGRHAALRLIEPSRLLFIDGPRIGLDHRLVAPLSLNVGRLDGGALGRVFSQLLQATAEAIDELTSEQLRPVELALTEFLVATLAAENAPASRGGAGAARAAHFHRVCQTIETLLPDPELSLARAAKADGVSTRSLQNLFADAGHSFSSYLRVRRLDRCRLDLTSSTFSSLSISEICFRWGFSDAAHFSRAFKEQYGVSPREHRKLRRPE